jgi:excisionase family DNA binding protein
LLKEPVQKEWLSYPEAERSSGLSHTTLWRYVRGGQIKAAKVGRRVCINRRSLDEFMHKHATQMRLFDPDDIE